MLQAYWLGKGRSRWVCARGSVDGLDMVLYCEERGKLASSVGDSAHAVRRGYKEAAEPAITVAARARDWSRRVSEALLRDGKSLTWYNVRARAIVWVLVAVVCWDCGLQKLF